MKIIKIGRGHIAHAAMVLTTAFKQDPIFRFIFGNAATYQCAAPWLFASWIKWAVLFGEAWITEGGDAVVITRKIGDARMSFLTMIRAGMLPTPFKLGWHAFHRFYFKVLPVLDKNHERIMGTTPHLYGWMIGATATGEGMARPLFNFIRGIADERQLPIFLETANGTNLSLYDHFGFRIVGQEVIAGDCTVYFLVRQPQTKEVQ